MQLIISIVTPFDFPRQVEYSCVISLSAAKLPRTITGRTSRHATTPNATVKSSPTVFMRGRRRARTSDLMIRSPPPRWDTILDRIASDRCQPRAGLQGYTELARISQQVMRTSSTDACRFRRMVRFLRRRICGQGRALTFMGVAETFVALNRGPRVAPMDM